MQQQQHKHKKQHPTTKHKTHELIFVVVKQNKTKHKQRTYKTQGTAQTHNNIKHATTTQQQQHNNTQNTNNNNNNTCKTITIYIYTHHIVYMFIITNKNNGHIHKTNRKHINDNKHIINNNIYKT